MRVRHLQWSCVFGSARWLSRGLHGVGAVATAGALIACGDPFALAAPPDATSPVDAGKHFDVISITIPQYPMADAADEDAPGDHSANEAGDTEVEGGESGDATLRQDGATDGPEDAADGDAGLGCASGQVKCNGVCTELSGDLHNCGACGHDCAALPNVSAAGLACTGGRCTYQCASGYGDCADGGSGCATLLQTASNCGGCGAGCAGPAPFCAIDDAGVHVCTQMCAAGTTNCSGSCVTLATDPNHCNACETVCQPPTLGQATCTGGQCGMSCSGAMSLCGSACTNELTDNANCGACAHACNPPMTCGGGGTPGACGCTPLTVCPSALNCGTIDNNGCGTAMLTCGPMSGACPAGQTCGGGGTANVCGCPNGPCPAVWDLSSWDNPTSLWGN